MPDPSSNGLWSELGISVKLLMAGFAGGVLRAFVLWGDRDRNPVAIVGAIVSGVLAAPYLGPTLGYYIKGVVPEGAAEALGGFLVGLSAMAIVDIISQASIVAVRRKLRVGNGDSAR